LDAEWRARPAGGAVTGELRPRRNLPDRYGVAPDLLTPVS